MRAAGWIVALALTVSFASVANARAQSLPACLDFAQPPTPALQQAAARGDIAAQTRLGTIDASGLAVPRDVARALPLLTAAARHGDARAQYQLGKLYEHDVYLFTALKPLPLNRFIVLPLMPDDRIAWHWYRQAARQGYVPAMWALSALETNAAMMAFNPVLQPSWQRAAQVHQRALHWLARAPMPDSRLHRCGWWVPWMSSRSSGSACCCRTRRLAPCASPASRGASTRP